MFNELTDDLLDLEAGEQGVEDGLLAVHIGLCCSLSCTCTCCE